MVEIEYMYKRMYKDVKTGEIIDPSATRNEDAAAQEEFLERFRRTDEYALLEYLLMMEGIL